MKLRVSLSQKDGDIKGTIELPEDGTFVFEGLKLVFDQFCKSNGYDCETVHADFYRFCVFGERP